MALPRNLLLICGVLLIGLLAFSLTLSAVAEPAVPIGRWTALGDLPQPRASLGVVTHAGEWLYSIGGRDAGGNATAEVWRARVQADGSLGAWEAQPSLSVKLYLHAVVTAKGYVYVIGGYDGLNYHSEVWRAQIANDGSLSAWQPDRDYPVAVTLHAAIAANNRIYVSGGDTLEGRTNRVYFATIDANGALAPWQETISLPPASLYRHAMVATDTTLYAIGGYDGRAVRAEAYAAPIDAGGMLGAWQTSALPSPREYHAAVIHDGRLMLLGGRDNPASPGLTRVDTAFMNPDGSLSGWANDIPLPEPLYRFGAVTVRKYGSDFVYVLGGLSGNQQRASVYRSDVPPTPTPTPAIAKVHASLAQWPVGTNQLRYEIVLENVSGQVAHQVIVTNQVPGGVSVVQVLDRGRWQAGAPAQIVWQLGSLAPGATTRARYIVQVFDAQAHATQYDPAADWLSDTIPGPAAPAIGSATTMETPASASTLIYNVGALVTWWGGETEYAMRTNVLYWLGATGIEQIWLPLLRRQR